MKYGIVLFFTFFVCVSSSLLFSQTADAQQSRLIDSLKLALRTAKHDTTRCHVLDALIESEDDDAVWPGYNNTMQALCETNLKVISLRSPLRPIYLKYLANALNNIGYLAMNKGDYSKALDYYYQGLKIEEGLKNQKGLAMSLNNIAGVFQYQGDIPKALIYYNRSLKIQEAINNKLGVAEALNNIGYIYNEQGDVPKALDYFHKSLKLQEEITAVSKDRVEQRESKKNRGELLNNIGYIYQYQENFIKALEYFKKGLKLQEEIDDKNGMAASLNNIGNLLVKQKHPLEALKYHLKSLKIVEASDNRKGMVFALNNIGSVYSSQNDTLKALYYYHRGLKIAQEAQDIQGIISSQNRLANILLLQGKVREAQTLAERSLKLSRDLGFPENIRDASEILSRVYSNKGNWKEAYTMYRLYKHMSDSLSREANQTAAIQKAYQYTYEKKVIADSIHAVEQHRVFTAQLTQQKTQRTALYVGIALIALFALFMYNRFRLTNKQKQIIELKEKETQQQKNIIEEKHKEISDSIYYAERIQHSFLASTAMLDKHLKDYFVMFKPKDVVSGDFYWAAELPNGHFAFATADSTGHGVPGAIMSILNITSLEKAVSEGFCEPSDLLNETRITIIERLKKDGSAEGGKDGMDASLICFDLANRSFSYAAANNPLLVIRDNQLIELPADKMPVGKFEKGVTPFTQNQFALQKGDMIYALTDGLPDQFGGLKGKKFMYKHLKTLLISIASQPVTDQKQKLENAFDTWRGNLEQVDDVTVVGIRIS